MEIFAVGLRWLPGATPPPINPMLESLGDAEKTTQYSIALCTKNGLKLQFNVANSLSPSEFSFDSHLP